MRIINTWLLLAAILGGNSWAQADSLWRSVSGLKRINALVTGEKEISLTDPLADPAMVDDSDSSQAGIAEASGEGLKELSEGAGYAPYTIRSNKASP